MRFKLTENHFLAEDGPHGEGNLVYCLLTLLKELCSDGEEKLTADGYQLHHKNYKHSTVKDNDFSNLCLLPVFSITDIQAGKFRSPNSSIHGKIRTLSSETLSKYLDIIEKYNAIDVKRSLLSGMIQYVTAESLKQDLENIFENYGGE